MKEAMFLIFHLLATLAKLLGSGGSRVIIAENLLLKQQLIIHARSRQRAANLSAQKTAFGAGPLDLFRCESIILKSHGVMVVMNQYTRRIIRFAVHAGNVDGQALCRMFNNATSEHSWPK
jgi:hypothetical protein